MNKTEAFDEEKFEAILASAARIRREIREYATSNIRKAQDKGKRVLDQILLRKTKENTGREKIFHLHGLVFILFPKLHPNELQRLKTRWWDNIIRWEIYGEKLYVATDMAVDNEKPPTAVITATSTPLICNEINYWDSLPNEFVEKILLFTIKESGLQTCETLRKMP